MHEAIATELAKILGVSNARITQYKKAGYLKKAERGQRRGRQLYDVDIAKQEIAAHSDPNYTKKTPQARYRNKKKRGGNGQGAEPELIPEVQENDTFLKWRSYTEQYKAADRKLDYEIKSGKYLLKSDIENTIIIIAQQLRESLLNAPARTSAIVAAKSKKAQDEIYQILLRQNELTLKDISEKLKSIII